METDTFDSKRIGKHGAKATEFLFMFGSSGSIYDRNNKILI